MFFPLNFLIIKQILCSDSIFPTPSSSFTVVYKQQANKTFEYDYLPFINVTRALLNYLRSFNLEDIKQMLNNFGLRNSSTQECAIHEDFVNLISQINNSIKKQDNDLFLFWKEFNDQELIAFEFHKNIVGRSLYNQQSWLSQEIKLSQDFSCFYNEIPNFIKRVIEYLSSKGQHSICSQSIIVSLKKWISCRTDSFYKAMTKRIPKNQ
ncbi:hypothetical protein CDIK_3195 [Cucumispora dikerogammari]|nr:hypothetical protein CDIK_3195 [Cucumispora dikerogammari]